jgi:hypothetical protein
MTPFVRTLAFLTAAATLAPAAAAKDDALSLVPANAATVGVIHLADMRSSPLSSTLFQQLDQLSTGGEAEDFLLEAGLQPLKDVDTLVVATAPRTNLGSEADVLVIAEGRFQPERLAAALVSRGAVKKNGYVVLPDSTRGSDGETGAAAFLSSSLAIAGNEYAVVKALAAYTGGGTGFAGRGIARDFALVDPAATAWAIIDVPRAARLAKAGSVDTGDGQPGAALQAALKSVSTIAFWAKDTGTSLQLGATGVSNDAETLALLEDAIRGVLAAVRIAAQDKAPEMVSPLRRFTVDRKSGSISVEGSIPAAPLRELMAKQRAIAAK